MRQLKKRGQFLKRTKKTDDPGRPPKGFEMDQNVPAAFLGGHFRLVFGRPYLEFLWSDFRSLNGF